MAESSALIVDDDQSIRLMVAAVLERINIDEIVSAVRKCVAGWTNHSQPSKRNDPDRSAGTDTPA